MYYCINCVLDDTFDMANGHSWIFFLCVNGQRLSEYSQWILVVRVSWPRGFVVSRGPFWIASDQRKITDYLDIKFGYSSEIFTHIFTKGQPHNFPTSCDATGKDMDKLAS